MGNGVDFKAMAVDLRARLDECEKYKADLLEALDGMLEIYGVYESNMKHDSFVSSVEVDCCNKARAAIARARGEA